MILPSKNVSDVIVEGALLGLRGLLVSYRCISRLAFETALGLKTPILVWRSVGIKFAPKPKAGC